MSETHFTDHETPRPAGDREGLSLFLFRRKGRRLFGLSGDPSGANLPGDHEGDGAWTFVRPFDLRAEEVRADFDPRAACQAIAEDGYALIGNPFAID